MRLDTIDFGTLTDPAIAALGLKVAMSVHATLVEAGAANNDSLTIVLGVAGRDRWEPLSSANFGPDGAKFEPYVHRDTGKLATALKHRQNSGDVVLDALASPDSEAELAKIPEGARRFTGGVYLVARVATVERGVITRVFAGAASGIQGVFDETIVTAALKAMAAAWALMMQARFGKPAV